jgi:hypothetical protein
VEHPGNLKNQAASASPQNRALHEIFLMEQPVD